MYRYLGINRLLYKRKVNYPLVFIVQASKLKEELEEQKVKRDEVTIASVEDINMYQLIKILTIKKAAGFFARKLNEATNKTINLCLEIIRFRMSSTFISIDGDY